MTAAMATKRQILIVDDHPIVRQGLRRMFEAEPDLTVCGEADSATLNAIADWLSPQSLSGWIFYILLSSACFLPFRRYLNKGSDMRDDSHDSE